jgi:exportin-2 (importin alpha re-exporter)
LAIATTTRSTAQVLESLHVDTIDMASNVPALFAASLVIDQRKAAEAQLEALSAQKGFIPHLLQIVLDRMQPMQVRQAACLYFKNQIKQRWDDVST